MIKYIFSDLKLKLHRRVQYSYHLVLKLDKMSSTAVI
jgi:hypothetical protein